MKRVFAILLSGFCLCAGSSQASGQDALVELYGHGVHAYFSGNLEAAEQAFNQAIDSGSQDPRVYYFRGLTQTRRGGFGAGQGDFQTGAELEATSKRSVPSDQISKSLTRIQGVARIELEKARASARLVAKLQQSMMRRAEEEAAASTLPGLRNPGMTPSVDPGALSGGMMNGQSQPMPKTSPVPEVVAPPSGNPGDTNDPFKDDTPATPPPTETPKVPTDDPFASPFGT